MDSKKTLAFAALAAFCSCQSGDDRTAQPSASPALAAAASPSFDVGSVMKRVHFAYRTEGGAFTGGHSTYAVRAAAEALEVKPLHHVRGDDGELHPVDSAALRLETIAVGRGGASDLTATTAPRVTDEGHLAIERGTARESLENTAEGVEQSWTFAARPPGTGDLVVRLRASGETFLGESAHGLHFVDRKTGVGTRYGSATWVDADGRKRAVRPTFAEGVISLVVPADVADASTYPAVLDPGIGAEFGMDNPTVAAAALDQTQPRVASDGTNFLVVWQDQRANVTADLFGARVKADGTVLDPQGIAISTAASSQVTPVVAFDGTNYFVVWRDLRNGNNDIYGARVKTDGTVLDPMGIAICTDAAVQALPAVAWNGVNYQVIWGDTRNGNNDIFAGRVQSDGTVLDGNGFAVSNAAGTQTNPGIGCDNMGNCLVVWEDFRGAATNDVYGARVRSDGNVLDPAGIAISTTAGEQTVPVAAWDGTNYFVAWQDTRNGANDLYGARVKPNAFVVDVAGVPVCTSGGSQTRPKMLFDGVNYFVSWLDDRNGTPDIFGGRIKTDGTRLDGNGFGINTNTLPNTNSDQDYPAAAFGGGNYFVVWYDQRTISNGDIYGARVKAADTTVLDQSPILISTGTNGESVPAVGYDGSNYLVVWQDTRGTLTYDLYGTRVKPDGTVLDVAGLAISTAAQSQFNPAIGFDGTNYMVVWEDARNGYGGADIYGARVKVDGTVLEPGGFLINAQAGLQRHPALSWDGSNYMVVWDDGRQGIQYIYGARVNSAGAVVDAVGFVICQPGWNTSNPVIAFDGTNHVVAFQMDRTGNGTGNEIYANSVRPNTGLNFGSNVCVSIYNGAADQTNPAIAWDGANHVITYEDTRNGTKDIYAELVAPGLANNGTGFPVAKGANNMQLFAPTIAFDGTVHLIAWQRNNSGASADIYGTRMKPDGSILDGNGGFVVAASADDELTPAAVTDKNGRTLIAYARVDTTPQAAASRVRARFYGAAPNGGCFSNIDCMNGQFCVDGVCCNTTCTAQCAACNVQGKVGICSPVTGKPVGARAACATDGTACGGSCDGMNTMACAFPGGGTSCRNASCTNGVSTDPATCDGKGACPAPVTKKCDPFVCGGNACLNICAKDADCAGAAYCTGSLCVAKGNPGDACAVDNGCISGFCADGVCCKTACTGACDRCDITPGTCTPAVLGAVGSPSCAHFVCDGVNAACPVTCNNNNALCEQGYICQAGMCVTQLLANGSNCNAGNQCQSTFCVDGLCCNNACAGQCAACNLQNARGTCTAVAGAPVGGRAACASDKSVCGGTCDGMNQAACAYPAGNVSCHVADCANGMATLAAACDGKGACPQIKSVDCTPFACAGSVCGNACVDDNGCVGGNFCDKQNGVCIPKIGPGLGCKLGAQCQTGFCVDGVCCDSACTGQCAACNAGGSVGKCTAIKGKPVGQMRPACGGAGLCEGTCDGKSQNACAFPDAATTCAAATCSVGVYQSASQCDGTGNCVPGAKILCPGQCVNDTCPGLADGGVVAPPDLATAPQPDLSQAGAPDLSQVGAPDLANAVSMDLAQAASPDLAVGGNPAPDMAAAPAQAPSGCGCRVSDRAPAPRGPGLLILVGALALVRRRRR